MGRKRAAAVAPPEAEEGFTPKINQPILVPIEKLEPNPWGNPNVMSDADLGKLMTNIRENGFDEPLQVIQREDKYYIIGGHHRWKAGKLLGFKELPCVVYPWDDRRAMEECVRRNLLRGHLDHEKFGEFLAGYLKGESELDWSKLSEAFACREQDLYKAFAANDTLREMAKSLRDADEVPDAMDGEPSTAQLGDIWALGPHKIICGDASNEAVVQKLMGEDRASLVVTDPPYGVKYDGLGRPGANKTKDWSNAFDDGKEVNLWELLKAVFSNVSKVSLPRTAWYVWYAHKNRSAVEDGLSFVNISVHQVIVWVKPTPLTGYGFYPYQHEMALKGHVNGEEPSFKPEQLTSYLEAHEEAAFGWPKGEKPPHRIDKSRYLTTVWQADYDGKEHIRKSIHPSQKPVRLWEIPILHHTEQGQIVFDPFVGSGTAIIACERAKRVARVIELNPKFVDVAVRRWQNYTGSTARCLTRDVQIK